MMRLILEYNDYLEQAAASIDISEGANTSAPVVESDEEDRPIVVLRPPQKKAKTAANTPPKKITKKTTKQTDKTGETQSTSAATNTATTTETEGVLIESDEQLSLINLNRHANIQPELGNRKEH